MLVGLQKKYMLLIKKQTCLRRKLIFSFALKYQKVRIYIGVTLCFQVKIL